MVKCVNCDGTFVNIGALVEHHKECLTGSDVVCYAGTTTPITMTHPDPVEFLCMVCNVGVNLAAVGTYNLGPKVFCSSICQVKCQHESEAVLRDFQRIDASEAEAARQAEEASHLLSTRQLEEARLMILELEARLSARDITANIMQRTLKEKLALIQSSHLSDDPSDGDKADLSPR